MYVDVFVCGVKLKYSDIYDRFGCIDVHEQYSVVGNVCFVSNEYNIYVFNMRIF